MSRNKMLWAVVAVVVLLLRQLNLVRQADQHSDSVPGPVIVIEVEGLRVTFCLKGSWITYDKGAGQGILRLNDETNKAGFMTAIGAERVDLLDVDIRSPEAVGKAALRDLCGLVFCGECAGTPIEGTEGVIWEFACHRASDRAIEGRAVAKIVGGAVLVAWGNSKWIRSAPEAFQSCTLAELGKSSKGCDNPVLLPFFTVSSQ